MNSGEMNEGNDTAGSLENDPELSRLCRKAIEKLNDALDEEPRELSHKVDIAEIAVSGLRDRLIERVRRAESPSVSAEIRRLLAPVNAVISLMAGVVYPSGGIQRSLVEEARKVLKDSSAGCKVGGE